MTPTCEYDQCEFGSLVDEHERRLCTRCGRPECPIPFDDEDDFDQDDYYGQPTGSCDECGANLYASECEDFGGLCSSCAWHANQ